MSACSEEDNEIGPMPYKRKEESHIQSKK